MSKKPGLKKFRCGSCGAVREVEAGIKSLYCCAAPMEEVEEEEEEEEPKPRR